MARSCTIRRSHFWSLRSGRQSSDFLCPSAHLRRWVGIRIMRQVRYENSITCRRAVLLHIFYSAGDHALLRTYLNLFNVPGPVIFVVRLAATRRKERPRSSATSLHIQRWARYSNDCGLCLRRRSSILSRPIGPPGKPRY